MFSGALLGARRAARIGYSKTTAVPFQEQGMV
jgi:hypothetical protein